MMTFWSQKYRGIGGRFPPPASLQPKAHAVFISSPYGVHLACHRRLGDYRPLFPLLSEICCEASCYGDCKGYEIENEFSSLELLTVLCLLVF